MQIKKGCITCKPSVEHESQAALHDFFQLKPVDVVINLPPLMFTFIGFNEFYLMTLMTVMKCT